MRIDTDKTPFVLMMAIMINIMNNNQVINIHADRNDGHTVDSLS